MCLRWQLSCVLLLARLFCVLGVSQHARCPCFACLSYRLWQSKVYHGLRRLAYDCTGAPAQVCIFTKGGALLWTWQMAALRGLPVDALIRTCLLEERSGESSFSYTPPSGAAYTLKWTLHNVRSS